MDCGARMARIFVSHASGDLTIAEDWRRWLVGAGHQVFLDHDLQDGLLVGEAWEARLFERLRWADAVLCVVTPAFVASIWCTAEVAIARGRGSRLLPVLVEKDVDHPLLRSVHQVSQVSDGVAAARAAVGATLRRVDAAGGVGWPDDRSPFPGLRPFEADLHQAFFGREAEISEVADLLRSPELADRAVLVVGASGSGKSSLIRAGVRPALGAEPDWWTLPPIRPGGSPEVALAYELSAEAGRLGLDWTVPEVRAKLAAAGGLTSVAEELLSACPGRHPRRHLLVVIDQLEELHRLSPPVGRQRFADLLVRALDGPVRVLAAVRSEFLDALISGPLARLPVQVSTLRPIRREALFAVVEKPAALAGIEVPDGLAARMVADTGTGEALPLLAYTLAELAEGVRHGGRLSATRYDQLGGVRGALVKQADTALAEASKAGGRGSSDVIAGLLRLVTVDDQNRPSGRRIRRAELPEPVRAELDVFVAHRLLRTDTDTADGNTENGPARAAVMVGVAHERILSEWRPLTEAVAAQASALRARHAVQRAAEEWQAAGRPATQLWERGQLAGAVNALGDTGPRARRTASGSATTAAAAERPRPARKPLGRPAGGRHALDRTTVELTPQARTFLLASIRRDRRRRGRAVTVLSTLLLISTAATGVAIRQGRAAVSQHDIALSRQVVIEADALRPTDSSLAMQLVLAAYRIAPTDEGRSSLLSSFVTPPASRLKVHDTPIIALAVARDGHLAATGSADGTVRLTGFRAGHLAGISALGRHQDFVRSVQFSPDGRFLVSGSDDRTVRLWQVAGPARPVAVFPGHRGAVNSVAFSPDGRLIASGSDDNTIRLWNATGRRRPAGTLCCHTGAVRAVTFSPYGRVLASGSNDTTVRLWDVRDPRHPVVGAVLRGHADTITSVAFSPDGRLLASASDDRTVRLWDVSAVHRPRLRAVLTGHDGQVQSVAFSPDGRLVATGSDDRTVRVWDAVTGRPVADFINPAGIGPVAFGPDGDTLLAGGTDGILRWWNLAALPIPTGFAGSTALSASGTALVTGVAGGLQTWDVTDSYHYLPRGRVDGPITAAAFRPDGRLLATADADNRIQLWDVVGSARPTPVRAALAGHFNSITALAFSSDGRLLASASNDVTVRLWNVADPRSVTGEVLSTYRSIVRSIAFSPTGTKLASSGVDGVRLWAVTDARHYAAIGTFGGPPVDYAGSIAFQPNGSLLAAGSGDAIQLWDVGGARPVAIQQPSVVGHSGAEVMAVAISRNGRLLATGNDDRTIRLWDLSDLSHVRETAILTGSQGIVRFLAFTPTGFLAAADDHAVRLWDTDADRAARHVCDVAGSPITREEWEKYIPGKPYDPPCA
jgi:WD40 repeat protein